MDASPPISKSIKEFMDEMPMKKNDIPAICGKPAKTLCQPLMDAIYKNIFNIKDDRDLIYGKLHRI